MGASLLYLASLLYGPAPRLVVRSGNVPAFFYPNFDPKPDVRNELEQKLIYCSLMEMPTSPSRCKWFSS